MGPCHTDGLPSVIGVFIYKVVVALPDADARLDGLERPRSQLRHLLSWVLRYNSCMCRLDGQFQKAARCR